MKRNKFLEFIGFKFIVNNNKSSKEIHRVRSITTSCRISMMTDAKYITKRKAAKLLKNGHNGCRFCYHEKDNG